MKAQHRTKRGEQVVSTPRWLLDKVQLAFGEIMFDAAADEGHHVCPMWSNDSLGIEWPASVTKIVWCNPPFSMFAKFTAKAKSEAQRGVKTVMLATASISTNWWRDNVHEWAAVYPVPRFKFVGHSDPFAKDLCLLVFRPYAASRPSYFKRLEWRDPNA